MAFKFNPRTGQMEMTRRKVITQNDLFRAFVELVGERSFTNVAFNAQRSGISFRTMSEFVEQVFSPAFRIQFDAAVQRKADDSHAALPVGVRPWFLLWAQTGFRRSVVPFFTAVSDVWAVTETSLPQFQAAGSWFLAMAEAGVPPEYLRSLAVAGVRDFGDVVDLWVAGAPVEYAVAQS